MKNKRILLISSNSSGRGGGERYLIFLSRGLRALGCEVHALLSDIGYMDGWAAGLAAEGVSVHRRPLVPLVNRPLRFIQSIADKEQISFVADFCRELGPDGILVNQQYDEDGLDYLMGALASSAAPVCGLIHMPMTKGKDRRRFGRLRGKLLSKWYRENPYRLIFVSEGARTEFEAYYPAPRPTFVVNNSVPLPGVLAGPGSGRLWDGDLVLGFNGQFVDQKNIEGLIAAWLKLRRQGINTRLLLVGDGPERVRLERLLWLNATPGSWHITGWSSSAEDMASAMDVFVLASHFEGLPLSLVEAAGRGIPCVAAPFNGAADVARRAHWVKVAPDNSAGAMSAAIAEMVSQVRSGFRVDRESLGVFREYFSLERMAGEVLDIMEARS